MATSDTLLIQLKASLARRDRQAINFAIAALIAQPSRLGGTWKALASAALRNGEHRLALAAIERLVAESPDDPRVLVDHAAFLVKAGKLDRAAAIIAALPPDVPSVAGRSYLLGTIALNQGRSGQAGRLLLDAAIANPSSGQAWLALANVGPQGGSKAIGEMILASNAAVPVSAPEERAQYLHAQGKVLADRGDHRAAFESFAFAGALLERLKPFDRVSATERAEQMIDQFDRTLFDKISLGASPERPTRPIFVTGMPRSGTTLVEQILCSGREVADGGELALFRLLHQDIGGSDPSSIRSYAATQSLERIADLYHHLLEERVEGSRRTVDKSLMAGNYMGLLLALFPDAPVIWMRRDALDNGWSCFRTYFIAGLGWTNLLENIALVMRLQERLLDHWQALAPGRILTVDLEHLIADPETQIRRITDHCGVGFDPAMLTPERTERVVATASTVQVRAPINQLGIGAAEPYRAFLRPFQDAYHAEASEQEG